MQKKSQNIDAKHRLYYNFHKKEKTKTSKNLEMKNMYFWIDFKIRLN